MTLRNDYINPLPLDVKSKINVPYDFGLGITKREYFAALAMQGMVAGITKFRDDEMDIIVNRPNDIAEISCTYADALIEALNHQK